MSWLTEASGIAWYCGDPQVGKTTLGLKHLSQLITSHKRPALVLDCGGATQFRECYHESKLSDVVDALWGSRENCYYTPETVEEVDRICKAIRKAGDVLLFVDEAIHVLNAKGKCSTQLLFLMRTRAHAHCHVMLTTQHLSGDIPPEAFSCDPELYIFRSSAEPAQVVCERRWQMPPAVVANLTVGQYLQKSAGQKGFTASAGVQSTASAQSAAPSSVAPAPAQSPVEQSQNPTSAAPPG